MERPNIANDIANDIAIIDRRYHRQRALARRQHRRDTEQTDINQLIIDISNIIKNKIGG